MGFHNEVVGIHDALHMGGLFRFESQMEICKNDNFPACLVALIFDIL